MVTLRRAAAGLALAARTAAFYLPGIAPTEYARGDNITIVVNSLSSFYGEEEGYNSVFNVDYYDSTLNFCPAPGPDGPVPVSGSLGSILFGDRLYESPMTVKMLEDVACVYECGVTMDEYSAITLFSYIAEYFVNHWTIDGLPIMGVITREFADPEDPQAPPFVDTYNMSSIPLGELDGDSNGKPYGVLFNHFDFVFEYHATKSNTYRVVGAQAHLSSRGAGLASDPSQYQCNSNVNQLEIYPDQSSEVNIPYSYSVTWKASETPWATRWDAYLPVYDYTPNWFALVNSLVLVVFLVALCSLMLLRLLRRDIASYNEVDLSEPHDEDIGWKLVHGDVFRAPRHLMAYSILIGTGAQVFASAVTTVFLAVLGLLSPANRGAFSTALLMSVSIYGGLAGYVSSVFYKAWGGERWKLNVLLTPAIVPLLVFAMFVLLNFLIIFHGGSGAAPFGSIVALVVMWIGIAMPISFFFGFLGRKREWFKPPVRTNQIPRQIPPQPWFLRTVPMLLLAGAPPFMAVALQLYYIISAIWFERFYYMFGFLFASMVAMAVISGAVTALFLYSTLSNEDYRWQWRSFLVSGSPGIYVFIYSVFYMYRYMHLATFQGTLLYLGYCLVASLLVYTALGVVGVVTSHLIVHKIYKSIKID